ncbi:anion transporter [Magnetospirillum molischianum]|uniref:Na+/H+ antiporter NhaD and related arsenite permease n=1 Tax=Magnetospirillum molischianum DSM 120 TaxID=1150626 RepID=H8FQJ2_MAGML|nr:anion transporter [Magnetospirillum molischianum]CCG40630.1 Na+/H+ antiporter NhaD and related arsenite permease [Magnetospirillum molischianum DSM 120]
MDTFVIVVFVLTYLGMAFGSVPGLKIDRTGIALVAVVALLLSGKVGVRAMGSSIDVPTLLLLFALMIVSAQFQLAGVYDSVATRVASGSGSPRRLLALVIIAAGGLSAVLANDVVCFAMTPIVAEGIRRRGLDPRPYLLGLVGAANAGSAATLIGNPQNILIGQVGGLDFWDFLTACAVPALASLVVVHLAIAWIWRAELDRTPTPPSQLPAGLQLHRWQAIKGVCALFVLALLFAAPLPREVGAMVIAGLLLASRRMSSREMIGSVDWHLLLLFACLFVVTGAFADTDLARQWVENLSERGLFPETLGTMVPLSLLASNSIGNVPAVMLILAVWHTPDPGALTGLALLSTLAGNFLLVGSMANIIVAERAASVGARLSFGDFARAGIPLTLVTMAIAVAWLWLGGWMSW